MRVLISSQYYRPAYSLGGTVTSAVAYAEELARSNHEVTVVTSTAIDLKARPVRRSQTRTIAGVTVHQLGSWACLNKAQVCPSVFNWAKHNSAHFDVVGIMGLYDIFGPAMARYARRAGIPYGVMPCGMICAQNAKPLHKRLYHATVGKQLLADARAIIVNSRNEELGLLEFGIDKSRTIHIPTGVWLTDFQRPPPRGEFRHKFQIGDHEQLILWMGRIDPIKNLEQLLEAVAGLQGVAWRLVIVGPTESHGYVELLRRRVLELGITERVHLHPPCYDGEKLSAFVDADLLALVSNYESWGHVAVEAMATGLPVLVTDTCGVAEMVGVGGGLIVRTDVEAIRAGLHRLLVDSSLRAEIKARLPSLVRQYSWERSVEKLAALFQSWIEFPLNEADPVTK